MSKDKFFNENKFKLIEIAKKFDLDLFILFGSRAKGNFKESSDYDFAYFSKNKINEEEFELEIFKIFDDKAFDLINLSEDLIPELYNKIFFEGEIIFEKNKFLFDEFKLESFFKVQDAKELLYKTRDKFIVGI